MYFLFCFLLLLLLLFCVFCFHFWFFFVHTLTHTHSRSRVFLIKLRQSHVVFERALQIAIVAFGTILVFNFYFIVAAANAKTNAKLKVTRQQHTTHTSAQLEHSVWNNILLALSWVKYLTEARAARLTVVSLSLFCKESATDIFS